MDEILHVRSRQMTEFVREENSSRDYTVSDRDLLKHLAATESPGIVTLDSELRIRFWNAGAEKITGMRRAEVFGKKVNDVFPFVTETGEYEFLQKVLKGETVTSEEQAFAIPETQKHGFYKIARAPMRGSSGQVEGILAVVEDVTAAHQIKLWQRMLLDSGELLMASLDREKLIGSFPDVLVPKLADWCAVFTKSERKPLLIKVAHKDPVVGEKLFAALSAKTMSFDTLSSFMGMDYRSPRLLAEVTDKDWVGICSDEFVRTALISSNCRSLISLPLQYLTEGGPVGEILIGKCEGKFSEQDFALARVLGMRMSLALENAGNYEKANAAIEAREDLMAILSHDLRNPLSTIKMATDLIQQTCDKMDLPGQFSPNEFMPMIDRSLRQAQELVSTILDVSLINQKGMTVNMQQQPLLEIIDDVVKLFKPQAERKSIKLTVEFECDASLKLALDRVRIMQAISNVIGNALKFSPENTEVVLRVRRDSGKVRISIEDHGPGIPGELLPRIFERHWQAEGRKKGGIGLGLYITKGVIEAHGGQISAESACGKGTIIKIELPLPIPA